MSLFSAFTESLTAIKTAAGWRAALGIGEAIYPVGSLYFSTNSTNPATSLGFGTWAAFGAGRVPVGFDSGETEFDVDEEIGGEKTHTLVAGEVPSLTIRGFSVDTGSGAAAFQFGPNVASGDITDIVGMTNAGGGAHNNLQPYIVVRMWKRLT